MKKDNSLRDFVKESIPIINREAERIWYKVKDVTVFEQRCLFQITSTYHKIGSDINNRQALITRLVKREAANCIKRSNIENIDSLESLAERRKDTPKKNQIQIKDVLADVESEVFAKEKVANLAESDLRKEIILNAWMDGCTCLNEISGLLADKLGGKQETHRKYVQRFREKCKQALTDVA